MQNTGCFCTGKCRVPPFKCGSYDELIYTIRPEMEITYFPVKGWECPVCGRGNAPTRPTCPCFDEKKKNGRQSSKRSTR